MRVAIIGGRLQGLEAVYLAKKAGWQTLLVDKEAAVPAAGLCDRFLCLDALNAADQKQLHKVLDHDIDLIIPALENSFVLKILTKISAATGVPLAFDSSAYDLSSSKLKSDRYFADHQIPAPLPWPGGTYPYLAKPSGSSGSEGVILLESEKDLQQFKEKTTDCEEQWVIQEYIEGPSYSIEVIGDGTNFLPLQVTDLYMDQVYDCKRVIAPSALAVGLQSDFAALAERIASGIGLWGIMDVEVILHSGHLKVLEIDARLPSQTPTAVFHSTGVNMLELLAAVFTGDRLQELLLENPEKAAIFEHIVVNPENLQTAGEHVIASAGPLNHLSNFFGAEEALTNFLPSSENWVATLITTGRNREEAFAKRDEVLTRIARELNLKRGCD